MGRQSAAAVAVFCPPVCGTRRGRGSGETWERAGRISRPQIRAGYSISMIYTISGIGYRGRRKRTDRVCITANAPNENNEC